ncbi:hypothetical protein [Candidatus Pelagisphaera phototrophica]|uniref:hypothetical protein n=1 Tax=Candidatus Pelagisphaera phototrophica TaxID=2684113 RepID=UPI001A012B77|nr:hypothetical protein [Candidatus Pelagisphaera phototrophica]QXD32236.1 hypothetical protein GA004_00460 [Candidatus Pelagisphaera phototrophica]
MSKKWDKKVQVEAELNWRPDFRDRQSLPDIKTVRTTFFISAIAVTIALMSVMHVGFQEYTIYSLGKKIEEGKAEIAARQALHVKAIRMNNLFLAQENRIDEINTFEEKQLAASDLILDSGKSLSPGMSLLSIDYIDEKAVFQGFVVASEETDSLLKDYMEKLRNVDSLKDRYADINQVSVERESGTDLIKFHLEAVNPEEGDTSKKKS